MRRATSRRQEQLTGKQKIIDAAHIAALSAFAVAQPLLQLISSNAEYLVVHRSQPLDMAIFLLILFLLVPLPMILIENLVGLVGRRARNATHLLFVGLLVGTITIPILKKLQINPGIILLAIAALLGAAASLGYTRLSLFRRYASLLVLSIPAFALLFLLNPDVRKVLLPKKVVLQKASNGLSNVSVALLVFDGLPLISLLDDNEAIDEVLYPNFSALASDALWFRKATTVSDGTLRAVPAILTGKYPDVNLQPILADHPRNLFTAGYSSHELVVAETHTQLWPQEPGSVSERLGLLFMDSAVLYLHTVVPDDLNNWLPPVSQGWQGFAGDAGGPQSIGKKKTRIEEFEDFIDQISPNSQPTIYFHHSVLPHAPYQHYPSGKRYTKQSSQPSGKGDQWGLWDDDEVAIRHTYQRHLLQVQLADQLLGKLIARLKDQEMYEDALIIITADHGESFWPSESHRKVTVTNFKDILLVPLLLKLPRQQERGVSDKPVETVDILPTIAELLEIDLGWDIDGRSMIGDSVPNRSEQFCVTSDQQYSFDVARFHDIEASLERKLSIFGSRDPSRLYAFGRNRELVGRKVSEVLGDAPQISIALQDPKIFEKVESAGDLIPGEIVGFVKAQYQDPVLAVAINGVIQSVTLPYKSTSPGTMRVWSVLVAQDAFLDGENHVQVYEVVDGGEHPAVRRTSGSSLSFVGVPLGSRYVAGVEDSGFYQLEIWKNKPTRWTNGHATLVVPIAENDNPSGLSFDFASTGPLGTQLRLVVNGVEIFNETTPKGRWSKAFEIASVTLGSRVTIEIFSDTFFPESTPGSRDQRSLGVAVQQVLLLYDL